MLLILLILGGALGFFVLLGYGLGTIQHKLTAPRPRALLALPKTTSPALEIASPYGEVGVGRTLEPGTASSDAPTPPPQAHRHEPSLAEALAMEHVNS